jgi:hypothetical protein
LSQQNEIIDNNHLTTNKTDTLNYGKTNSVEKNESVEKSDSVEKSRPSVIDTDKAIIVSDLHIGYEKCNATAFTDFLADQISKGIRKNIHYLF